MVAGQIPVTKIYEDEVWIAVEKNLTAAISGELDLESELEEKIMTYQLELSPTAQRPHRVKIDNKSSSFFSIIEVFTYDYKGLLFRLTDILYKNNLDIWIAKIATKADQVVDVFYVRNVLGGKIQNDEDVKRITDSIYKILPNQPRYQKVENY
jgi:[protein-PII] uridylyltransferase